MRNTVALIVLDGWGLGEHNNANAIDAAHPQTIDYIRHNFAWGSLQASGISVGLPWGEEGNSEVGHMTMGVGRVIYQHYPRISLAIRDKSFFQNETILQTFAHAKNNKSRVHLIGLVGEANVHSSMEHISALLAMAKEQNVPVVLHCITDGRDSPPQSAWSILSRLPIESIGSISGRYYAMDRDKQWNLVHPAYQAIVGEGTSIEQSAIQRHLQETYEKNLNDEYVAPVGVDSKKNAIQDNDAIFFFNFREDRMRQMASAFLDSTFDKFPVKQFSNVFVSSMTQIRKDLDIPNAFPPQIIKNTLGSVLEANNKSQLRVAETQKYAHVTFFFNGLRDKPFNNEYRILIPSKPVRSQQDDPHMMAEEITNRIIGTLDGGGFDFVLANYANPDMVAHTGDFDATVAAIQWIDKQLARLLQAAFRTNTTLLITADHGNAERLFNPQTGEVETKHDSSPVPFFLVGPAFYRSVSEAEALNREKTTVGLLSDIAPTILDLMHLQKPPDMTGQSLLRSI